MPVTLSVAEIEINEDVAVIRNTSFRNALVSENAQTVESLRSKTPSIQFGEITIDDLGRVVINNRDFAELVRSEAALNVGCGGGCVN